MYKKLFALLAITILALLGPTSALADTQVTGLKWNNHAAPFGFKFWNLIDNHQQTQQLPNGRLQGFIYVQFTGEMIDGIPVAQRADCDNPALDCRVGWNVIGIQVDGAKLVQTGPRLWQIDPEIFTNNPGFVHFHWTKDSLGRNPKKPCGLVLYDETSPITYSGYLLKRTAVTTFYWLGGNADKEKGRLVSPGIDLHSNLEGLWAGGGGHDSGGGHDTGYGHDTGNDSGGSHDDGHDTGDSHDSGGCGGH